MSRLASRRVLGPATVNPKNFYGIPGNKAGENALITPVNRTTVFQEDEDTEDISRMNPFQTLLYSTSFILAQCDFTPISPLTSTYTKTTASPIPHHR